LSKDVTVKDSAIFDQSETYVAEAKSRYVPSRLLPSWLGGAQDAIVLSSFFFALLQSICTFFLTVNGLRFVIGLGSLVVSSGVGMTVGRWHQNWIRLSMLGLALLGASLNLLVLMQIRHLRRRPASLWRQRPLSSHQIRMERIQMTLSLATLVLIGSEEYLHFYTHGHL
jgi:hypothetical protein